MGIFPKLTITMPETIMNHFLFVRMCYLPLSEAAQLGLRMVEGDCKQSNIKYKWLSETG